MACQKRNTHNYIRSGITMVPCYLASYLGCMGGEKRPGIDFQVLPRACTMWLYITFSTLAFRAPPLLLLMTIVNARKK